MSVSFWSNYDSHQKSITCDVCIVGAGISGLSTAYWLKKEDPNLKIVIIDKSTLGNGATGRNAGFITCGSVEHFNRMVSKYGEKRALEIWQFAEKNMELLQSEIIKNHHDELEFEEKGAFSLAAQESEFLELQQVSNLMSKYNIPVEVLKQNEIETRLGARGFVGGIRYVKDGSVNPLRLLEQVKNQTQFDLIENCELYRIEHNSSGTRTLLCNKGKIESTLVILCTNGYSSSVSSYFEDKIYPTRGQIMMLEPVKQFMEGPCYANFYLDYFRQLQNGALLIGGFRQLEADTEKGFSEHTTEKIQDALYEFVLNHLPQFTNAKVTHRWAGVMGFSADGEPMIGSLPTDNQTFFCGGFTGHGLGLAFHAAKSLVDLIYSRSVPDWLTARRF